MDKCVTEVDFQTTYMQIFKELKLKVYLYSIFLYYVDAC